MAKQQNGPQRDELKAKTSPDPRKIVETVVAAKEEPTKALPEKPVEKTVTVKKTAAVGMTMTKPELDRLANRTIDSPKETVIDLDKAVAEVKAENDALVAQKKNRKRAGTKIIRELRQGDPIGKKTCGYCGHRVPLDKMDQKKELCEVCAS